MKYNYMNNLKNMKKSVAEIFTDVVKEGTTPEGVDATSWLLRAERMRNSLQTVEQVRKTEKAILSSAHFDDATKAISAGVLAVLDQYEG